jgi:hypothetical protein
MRSLVAGILLGIAIAIVWRNLTQPQGTPPPRKGKVIDIFDTTEFERVVS